MNNSNAWYFWFWFAWRSKKLTYCKRHLLPHVPDCQIYLDGRFTCSSLALVLFIYRLFFFSFYFSCLYFDFLASSSASSTATGFGPRQRKYFMEYHSCWWLYCPKSMLLPGIIACKSCSQIYLRRVYIYIYIYKEWYFYVSLAQMINCQALFPSHFFLRFHYNCNSFTQFI